MKRRDFLKLGGVGLAANTVAAPALAQSMPEIKWRLAASWPKSLDTLYGQCEYFCKRVAEITDNRLQIQPFAAGEIVPGLQVLDAVSNGTVEMGNTALYYYWGKNPAFTFGTSLPFGLNTRQHISWLLTGDGQELLNNLLKEYGCIGIPTGSTGAQMGGWFRKEIKSMDDLKGLKFRVGGFAGTIIAKVGGVPQQIAGGDIYPALEKGPSMPPSGSAPMTTRSSASSKLRSTTTIPAGGKAPVRVTISSTSTSGMRCPSTIRPRSNRHRATPSPGSPASTMPSTRRR